MSAGLCFLVSMLGTLWSGCAFSTTGSLVIEAPAASISPTGTAYSEKIHVVSARLVAAKFRRSAGELPAIVVQVTNRGGEPFRFSAHSIQALADASPVQVFHPHEYAHLVQREAEIESLAADARHRGAMIRAASHGDSPATAPVVTAKVADLVERVEVKDKQRRLMGDATEMLQPRFVGPGQTCGGVIRLKAEPLFSAQRLYLRIAAGSEVHEIAFKVNP